MTKNGAWVVVNFKSLLFSGKALAYPQGGVRSTLLENKAF
jgi:hypothetical protein